MSSTFKPCPGSEWSKFCPRTWQESPEIVKAEPTTRACDRPSLPADRSPSFRLRFDVIKFDFSLSRKNTYHSPPFGWLWVIRSVRVLLWELSVAGLRLHNRLNMIG